MEGRAAACVNCHRRSGLGMIEGQSVVPPITGEYLFHKVAAQGGAMAMPHPEAQPEARSAYTLATLARALREGVDPDGRQLSYLMPRFALDDAAVALLAGYFKQLSRESVPGVGEDSLQFATIVTPDADPVARDAMLSVLKEFFGPGNVFLHGETPPLQHVARRHGAAPSRWQLHVWTLEGPASTWEAQLRERLRHEPVFAVISGVGHGTWAPVHRFCESESIPCLLPNVDLPFVAQQDFYPVYYSKGVLLEAGLIVRALQDRPPAARPRRVVQIYRDEDIGADAAGELHALANAASLETVEIPLQANASKASLLAALKNARAGDAVALWLRAPDLELLSGAPPEGVAVAISGIMGGLENAPLPQTWRQTTQMTYPYELPDRRRVLLNYPFGWMRFHHVPVIDERIQVDTYTACGILTDTIAAMKENFGRDYLVERLEAATSWRLVAGNYPRLGLGPSQRFASKGGYLVRFTEGSGSKLTPLTDWIVP